MLEPELIVDGLNPAQREAVLAPLDNTLILAGAGSGKTRVLVHRIAWLVYQEGISPYQILAVTFTNKAARELRERIEGLLQTPQRGLWVGTFHGIAHRLLRMHHQQAGLSKEFQILDSDDQIRLLKRVIRSLDLDEAQWAPRQVASFINGRKDEGVRADKIATGDDLYLRTMARLYQEYERICRQSSLVDFAELLLRTWELLRDDELLRQQYRSRFASILVDEFQDTNAIQYAFLQLLNGDDNKLFLVGDDDQSIYGWRGAKIENIQQLQRHYPGIHVARLEQNYRSTGNILGAANAVIANNQGRLGKELWTAGEAGEPIRFYRAFNDQDEASYLVGEIDKLVQRGSRYAECAVLYRTTAQSRHFEERFIQNGIPYRIYGGLRFFDRLEVRDAMGYLRLIANAHDDAAFERVVNTPPRGIGARTLEKMRDLARDQALSLHDAAMLLLSQGGVSGKGASGLKSFLHMLQGLRERLPSQPPDDLLEDVLRDTGLRDHHRYAKDGKGLDRAENLDELRNALRQFSSDGADRAPAQHLAEFLSHAALEAGDAQAGEQDDCVQLMTLHAAKGLEFTNVFLAGMDDGLFPHSLCLDAPAKLEEERRLCYVGMTRAMRRLYLLHSEKRYLRGQEIRSLPSRFLREIPEQFLVEVRMGFEDTAVNGAKAATSVAVAGKTRSDWPFQLGEQVRHPTFGEGVVLNLEGSGKHARAQINFAGVGYKWLILSYAKLTPC